MKQPVNTKKNQAAPRPLPQSPQFSRMRWVVLTLILLVACGGTWAIMEYVVWNNLPSELVGKWEVTQGPPEYKEGVIDFYRSGKMVGHFNDLRTGDLRVMNAEVAVEGDKFQTTTRRPSTGEVHVSTQTIRKLTQWEFSLVDEKGRVMKMKRIH